MARTPNHEIQGLWVERINGAKKRRADWARDFRVELGRSYFEGKQNPGWILLPGSHPGLTVYRLGPARTERCILR